MKGESLQAAVVRLQRRGHNNEKTVNLCNFGSNNSGSRDEWMRQRE